MSLPNRILVACDFSDCSVAAIDYACDLAESYNAKLFLLNVIVGHTPASPEVQDQKRTNLEGLNAALSAREELSLETTKEVVVGVSPQQIIVDYAGERQIDLIVMGTHGRKGLARLTMGSVVERVIRDAPCPVAVINPGVSALNLINQAIESISTAFGDSISGGREKSLEQVRKHLEESLQVPAASAERLIDELQKREWIQWHRGVGDEPGRLEIIGGIEFIEEPDTITNEYADSPALDLVHRAHKLRATDIHLDPKEHGQYSVRFRIDGKIETYSTLSRDVAEHLLNRFKMLSELDIAEPFMPKEARLTLPEKMKDLEVRITTAPVATGEAMALRLFSRDNVFLPTSALGLSQQSASLVDEMLRRGEGLVLVTGPTGSGKSTTVYSMLQSLSGGDKNIVSIEDPVEFGATFIRQMSVDHKHGITMTSGLRTMLRMDPDVIFVGEIRDREAAEIAVQAASSGRYVFSTLHTRDIASTITALRDLKISDRSLSGNLTGIINQRLIRRLCDECKIETEPTNEQQQKFAELGFEFPERLYRRVGCRACRKTGYRGRIGVFESVVFDRKLSTAVAEGQSERELRELLRSGGVIDLASDAILRASDGTTDMEEALKVHWLA